MKKFILIITAFVLVAISSSQGQTLIAHYPFNGNANDSAGTNDGIIIGPSWQFVTGHDGTLNSALELSGVSDYVGFEHNSVKYPQVYSQFTVTAWIKMETPVAPANWPIISFGYEGQTSNDYVTIGISHDHKIKTGNLNWGIYWDNSSISHNEFDFDNYIGVWVPVAYTFYGPNSSSPFWDQKSSRFWANGKSLLHQSEAIDNSVYLSSGGGGINTSFSDTMTIGTGRLPSINVNSSRFFKGAIDDVRIYAGILDSIQIDSIFNGFTSGINEVYEQSQLAIYPNPASETIKIHSTSTFQSVDIFTFTGQLVRSNSFKTTTETMFDISDLTPGIYLICVTSIKGVVLKQKLIVN